MTARPGEAASSASSGAGSVADEIDDVAGDDYPTENERSDACGQDDRAKAERLSFGEN